MEYRNLKTLNHWKGVVKSYEKIQSKRPLNSDERQQKYLAQSKVEDEYEKPCEPIKKEDHLIYELADNFVELSGYDGWKDQLRDAFIQGFKTSKKLSK